MRVLCAARVPRRQAPPDESEEEGLKEFAKFEKKLVGQRRHTHTCHVVHGHAA